ncbi:Cu+-exporting ATPase [Pelagirhabdus alkalitolerans]|uniref:Copper-exporting P-type ATPase n=1 Tax=Pelagirhabdus alkalitolerans TaxID=1612202 RepID=A0A1G6LSY8_9BACI|nr:heavy metal translocating P-type ATPase [Pelagirhabdus alkalitolerans]SDC46217.1 Cu+-exporting ATPase [Pelagirhabdus alkalitolerans]
MSDRKQAKPTVWTIDGMSCSSCSLNIEKRLNQLDGVIEANVNLASEKAKISYDENKISKETIEKEIKDLGYLASKEEENQTEKVTLPVEGMTCSACSNRIEKVVSRMDGVKEAGVNLPNEKITLEYDPNSTRLLTIQEKVEKLGYQLVLEKEEDETEDREERKINQAAKKMYISVGFASVIMILMVIHMFMVPIPFYLPIVAVLGAPVVFGTGLHVHKGAFKALRSKSPNMDVLVMLGSLLPYIIGLMGLFFPIQTFIEMATTIMTFHLVGKFLEVRAKGKASQAIKKLLEMGAKTARILSDGKEKDVPVKDLQPGDIMIIKPGEKVPTDGIVIEGNGLLDESMATGESMPVKREQGEEVIGATINKQGLIKVKVTKVGKDTFLSQVVKMMEEAQGSKVPIQEFADRITGYFVPAIMILTTLTFASYLIFPDFHQSIIEWGASFLPWVNPDLTPLTLAFITATAVLVISCPCALGLGTPTALMVGSGMGAEEGILIRNGEAIQTFKDVDMIAFDKTGTITKGQPEVTDLIVESGVNEHDLLYYTASIEKGSEHPLAQAMIDKAKANQIELTDPVDFKTHVGNGIEGLVDQKSVLIGNRGLMDRFNIDHTSVSDDLVRLENEAKTAMLVAVDHQLLGVIAVSDPIKEDSVEAIKALHALGIKSAMVTGDNERTAQAIAKKVGIDHYIAEVLPDGKVDAVKDLQKSYTVAMVGDGINDAPALKQASIGIAIGTGTDIAIEAADVTLVRGELLGIVSAVKLSHAIFKKIKQNYFWAWFYNAAFIPVAMLGLLHPMIGAAAMAVSSLNVVYNSLRLKRVDIKS